MTGLRAFTFGDTWASYRGLVAQTRFHAHAAIQLIAGEPEDFFVIDSTGREITGSQVMIRPTIQHMLVGKGQLSILYIEPLSPVAFALQRHMGKVSIACFSNESAEVIDVSGHPSTWPSQITENPSVTQNVADPRLLSALEYLSKPEIGHTIKLAAAECGLSESRLRALASQQLGFPLSTWLVWKKLGRASLALSKGNTLAESAYQGGFADQAHFSRTMRRMFGVSPSTAGNFLLEER